MKNVTTPRMVSFEDALRNLATKLTGTPASDLPRTQEGVVQFMAENVPSVNEMAEAITQEVMARLASAGEPEQTQEPDGSTDTQTQAEAPAGDADAKSGKKSRNTK